MLRIPPLGDPEYNTYIASAYVCVGMIYYTGRGIFERIWDMGIWSAIGFHCGDRDSDFFVGWREGIMNVESEVAMLSTMSWVPLECGLLGLTGDWGLSWDIDVFLSIIGKLHYRNGKYKNCDVISIVITVTSMEEQKTNMTNLKWWELFQEARDF